MNTNIHFVIGIRGKIPYKISGPDYIVTDNSDYTLELVPDAQWDGMEAKTIIYAYDNGTAVHRPIIGNKDEIPIVQMSGNLHIGVTAGDIRTSTWVSVPIRASVRRKAGTQIPPPAPGVYDQIMDLLNQCVNSGGIDAVEIQKGFVTGEGGVGEYTKYYLIITTTSGEVFRTELPYTEADPEDIVQIQSGAPTADTEGVKNQLLVDTETWELYVCIRVQLTMGKYTYIWKKVNGGSGTGGGVDFTPGNALKMTNGVLDVQTTDQMEEGNDLPITSAGVYTVVGNINALLDTI